MPQVSFYQLDSPEPDSRLQFACRLTERAREAGHRVFILTDSDAQAQELDSLLWNFKPSGFLPHTLLTGDKKVTGAVREAVLIGNSIDQVSEPDMLINLSGQACQQHALFQRIDEILCADEQVLAAGRENYRYYRSQGLQAQTHKI